MNIMAKKIKMGDVTFTKNVGHDTVYDTKFRVMTAELDNGGEIEFKSYNQRIRVANQSIRVIVTMFNKEGQDIGQLMLTDQQSPKTILALYNEINKSPEKLK